MISRISPLVLAVLIVAALVALGRTASAQPAAIVATFEVQGETFRARIENPATIEQVLALQRGEGAATIPNGRVLRGSDDNEPWSWHLDPHDIEMAEFAIELCDGTPSMVETDIDYWADTVGRFCPWSAKLLGVEEIKETRAICIDPFGTFDPRQTGGGCLSYDIGKDRVTIFGRALLNDADAPPGTTITAMVDGQECGSDSAGPLFRLIVSGAGERPGCAEPGDAVRFTIGTKEALETYHWTDTSGDFSFAFLSLTAVDDVAWYWFERVSTLHPEIGMHVEAYVAGVLCGEALIGGESEANGFFIPPGIRGFSRLVVPHQDVQPGCAVNASLVEFRVNGLRAETAVFWQPGVRRLDLLVQGDADCDFLVDSRDALLALQVEAALIDDVPCHGDADRDGDIDVFDARHILEFGAGITPELPL